MNTVEFPRLGIEFPINNVAFKVLKSRYSGIEYHSLCFSASSFIGT